VSVACSRYVEHVRLVKTEKAAKTDARHSGFPLISSTTDRTMMPARHSRISFHAMIRRQIIEFEGRQQPYGGRRLALIAPSDTLRQQNSAMMTLFPTRRPSARLRLTAWCAPNAVVLDLRSVLRTNASYPRHRWTGLDGTSQGRRWGVFSLGRRLLNADLNDQRFGEANSSSRER
jgi:hypothetical protein